MKPSPEKPLSLAQVVAAFACLFAVLCLGSPATSAASSGGGLGLPDTPEISDVICLTGCSTIREVSAGGSIQITGSRLNPVTTVAFPSGNKALRVKADRVSASRVTATVPEGAVTGRIRVVTSFGAASAPSRQVLTISRRNFDRVGKLVVTDASTSPRKAYQYGMRRPVLSFVVNGSTARVDLRVDVVRSDGTVVRSRFLKGVSTGTSHRVGWSGLLPGKKTAPNGAYRFVIRGADGTIASLSDRLKRELRRAARAARTGRGKAANPFGFRMYGFMFPVRGPHRYGDGIGAPRSGHTHQGQDILARCGLPLRAARAGVVYYNSYQAGGAGNYLVINTIGTRGKSHVYMHMPRRSPLKVGSRVRTGQMIGRVGTTGASSACHLHFEIWSSPGWYQGGTFLSPTAAMRSWDRYS